MNQPLEDGKGYKNGRGETVTIMGPTKLYPEWVWSLQGNWYERSSGRFLWYDGKTGQHVLRDKTPYDIVLEE